ncbi:hypothetical protein O5D80_002263 [Batrachochytrium dendrobatidis]|nr:hypothetical protein O5D80_002263 [Batrachochytrium dendrobatidis]
MLTRKMPSALVYGGSGALGRAIVSHFRNADWNVVSLDFSNNPDASSNIVLEQSPAGTSLAEIGNGISDRVANALESDQKLDAILTVAGGWAGGNLVDKDLLGNTELMITQSIYSSVISAKLAATYLKEGGLLTLTGASAATHGTPGMIGYGLAKAAVHQLVKSAAGPNSGLPAGAKVVAILPITMDTPMNRKFMADADKSTWTPLSEITSKMMLWASGKESVESGSLFRLATVDYKTEFQPVI